MRLGIDFGTCYSSAALLLDNTLKPIKEPLKHGYSFPSSVFLTPEREMLVGFAAENRRLKDIQRYKNEFKRVLGKPEPLFLGDRQLQPDELVTEVIVKLKTEADKVVTGRGEQSLSQAILTVPATYLSNKRQLMLQACDRAGFNQVQLLEEPVAAAIYYSNTAKIAEGDIILVYDLGGGTFDVTLLQKQNSGYQILGMPDGDPNCGGVDFDRFIFQELLKNCSEELRQRLLPPKERRRERAIVLPLCRDLKRNLSEATETEITIPLTMESFSLTRERFNEMIDDLISETINCCDRLISNTKLEWSQIDRVLLVGGSCRIPYVREVIARKWGKTPSQIDDPELAVCLGAAIYGTELDSESPESYLQKGLAKIQAEDYQNAIAEFNRAIGLDSNYAPAYCHRGLVRAQLKEESAALADYDLAIRLDRNYGEAYLHRGDLRCQFNDLKGAIEDYNYALFVNPDLTEAAEKKELVFERLISISQPQVTNSTVSVDEMVQADEQEVNLESDENQQSWEQYETEQAKTKDTQTVSDNSISNPEAVETQLKPKTSTYNPGLPSEWGADYSKLRDLLAAGNWKEADLETKAIFQKFVSNKVLGAGCTMAKLVFDPGVEIATLIMFQKAKNLPGTDLSTIDRLWIKYSNSHFGFSVQEEIFTQVRKKLNDFGKSVGWRENSKTLADAFTSPWKAHNQLTFSSNAPRGHLPSLPWHYSKNIATRESIYDAFYSRIKSCQLSNQTNGSIDSKNTEW